MVELQLTRFGAKTQPNNPYIYNEHVVDVSKPYIISFFFFLKTDANKAGVILTRGEKSIYKITKTAKERKRGKKKLLNNQNILVLHYKYTVNISKQHSLRLQHKFFNDQNKDFIKVLTVLLFHLRQIFRLLSFTSLLVYATCNYIAVSFQCTKFKF